MYARLTANTVPHTNLIPGFFEFKQCNDYRFMLSVRIVSQQNARLQIKPLAFQIRNSHFEIRNQL
jgi:hypothetical protein